MLIENNNDRFIDLKSLSKILLLTDIRSTEKWCNNKNIAIQIIGNKRLVHRFLVDMEIDKHLVNGLKNKYPDKWEELYRCYQDDDKLGYLILLDDFVDSSITQSFTRIKPQSRFAKILANS